MRESSIDVATTGANVPDTRSKRHAPIISKESSIDGTKTDPKVSNTTVGKRRGPIPRESSIDAVKTGTNNVPDNNTRSKRHAPFISYSLIRNLEFQNKFKQNQQCNETTHKLSKNLKAHGLLDFHVKMKTNLKILLIGDSVGNQFAHALQEAMGASSFEEMSVIREANITSLNVTSSIIYLSSPTDGGGAMSGWRITGLLSSRGLNDTKRLPNNRGGGWLSDDVQKLRYELWRTQQKKSEVNEIGETTLDSSSSEEEKHLDNFDVVIHQLPLGWLDKPLAPQFSHEALREIIDLSYEYFGAKYVILQTVHVSNNIVDIVNELLPINKNITDFAHSYIPPSNGKGVQKVLVMDLAAFSMHLYAENSANMGYFHLPKDDRRFQLDTTTLGQILYHMTIHRLSVEGHRYETLVGTVCRKRTAGRRSTGCLRNRFIKDGMHWCLETTAGRINGVIGCLLRCIYKNDNEKGSDANDLRSCEQRCNESYMNLRAIPWGDKTWGNKTVLVNY